MCPVPTTLRVVEGCHIVRRLLAFRNDEVPHRDTTPETFSECFEEFEFQFPVIRAMYPPTGLLRVAMFFVDIGKQQLIRVAFFCKRFLKIKIHSGELGLEPRFNASKAHVLPLDDSPIAVAGRRGIEPR